MKKSVFLFLLILFIGFGSTVFAEDQVVDCDCKKGGIGLPIGGFIIGFGFKQYNTIPGCNQGIGIGLALGKETNGIMLGVGYNQGVIGLAMTFRGPEKTTIIGPVIGYDYGDCRMVWPIEE